MISSPESRPLGTSGGKNKRQGNRKRSHCLTGQTLLQRPARSTSALGSTSDIVWTGGKGPGRTRSQQPGWTACSPSSRPRGEKFSGQPGDPSFFRPVSETHEKRRALETGRRRLVIPCPVRSHENAFGCGTQITNRDHYQSPAHVATQGRSSTVKASVVNMRREEKRDGTAHRTSLCVCVCVTGDAEQTDYQCRRINPLSGPFLRYTERCDDIVEPYSLFPSIIPQATMCFTYTRDSGLLAPH